ncbi:MAG: hypothetical protein A2539_08340 [Elusimicrobia bacterium RIFOXYD2_FULL_34_15]|nr:MAG: hypothetical protein A2539_08340 [Elusimicrobia bacterium RIFOXYD2_FULL_34_15]
MKKIEKLFLPFIVLLVSVTSLSLAEVKVAPYYSLQFTEGAFVPNIGEWNFSINLLSDLGVIVKPQDSKHSFVGFYELKYLGPGLRSQEGEKFTDRAMDHMLVLRHTFNISEDYFLKSQIDYMKEYKRTGTNEVWGTGLYDLERTGGLISFGRRFSDILSVAITEQYHFMDFPNYTDLFAEFQAGGANLESSTGKQNHKLYQTGLTVDYYANRFSFDITSQNYIKQKVAVESVQPDGTYYSSDLQKDTILTFADGYKQKLFEEKVAIEPTIAYKIKGSNQNFLFFKTVGSTETPTYFEDYYSYNGLNFSIPVAFMIGEQWEVSANPQFDIKTYAKRPPRNGDGDYDIGQKQKNNMFILSSGFTFKPNVVTRTTLFYVFQVQSSNVKFEKYLPYNYSANFFGIKFEYSY